MDTLYQFVTTVNSCGVAVTTLLAYDWCISLSSEITLFWRAPRTSASLLYLFNRYCVLLEWALALITIHPVSDTGCHGLYYITLVLADLAMVGPAVFSALRVYALSGQQKLLVWIVLGLGLIPFVINVSAAYQSHPVNFDPPINCSVESNTPAQLAIILTFLARSAPTMADFIVIAVTWRETYRASRAAADTINGPSFNQVMLHNGCIYFVVFATLNILHIILTALSIKIPSGSESYVINFIDPIASVLVCHFLISLQEAKHASCLDTTPSFVHPNIAISKLPSFVAPLAGTLAVYGDPMAMGPRFESYYGSDETSELDPESGQRGSGSVDGTNSGAGTRRCNAADVDSRYVAESEGSVLSAGKSKETGSSSGVGGRVE